MRLWSKSYGKATKVQDFAGREIAKGAYNDRNSEYGWNVDHILPQSRGGKTADYNLICCHILTNDEKADRFPCFSANGRRFQIIKVENHYEIQSIAKIKQAMKEESSDEINYYDSASGIRFFKRLKGIQNKPRFVGTVVIHLNEVVNTALIDFIENFFDEENISYSMESDYYASVTTIQARNYNMPTKDDIAKLLDKCILLNTYLGHYFAPAEYLKEYDIYFRVDHYREKTAMYIESQKIRINPPQNTLALPRFATENDRYHNSLFINDLVYLNTEASEKVEQASGEYTEYNFVFTQLSKNLNKEVNKE